MRLDKYLADMSVGTRSEVKAIIRNKRIKVNDEIITKADYKLKDDDRVYLDDIEIIYEEYEYYLLNKPAGYLSATEDRYDPVVMDLIESKRKDLSPVGRLDKDTEGLLLITNDGLLNHQLLSPKSHVSKKYYVVTDKPLPENSKEMLESPMDLGDFITKPGIYEKIDDKSSYLTIYEGKYHQVKRMYEKLGLTVTYLQRVEFAFLKLDNLKIGEYRRLSEEEIDKLKSL